MRDNVYRLAWANVRSAHSAFRSAHLCGVRRFEECSHRRSPFIRALFVWKVSTLGDGGKALGLGKESKELLPPLEWKRGVTVAPENQLRHTEPLVGKMISELEVVIDAEAKGHETSSLRAL